MRYIHIDVGQVSTNCLDQSFSTAGPRPGINYTGPQEVLLEVVILVF